MLQAITTISNKNRNSCVDIFRGIAIITVVLFHFEFLPFGYLGVDIFFVISGLLVSPILIKDFEKNKKINFFKFVLQRGFKIWPSYYTMLIVGNLIIYFWFRNYEPNAYIETWDLKRYLFFYQNYTGPPYHLSFDGVWSLCIEEHFYILLPIGIILLQYFNGKKRALFLSISLVILLGFVFKICSLYFTNSKDTFAGTHNRIDNLAWGVLLYLLTLYYPALFKNRKIVSSFFLGLVLLIVAIWLENSNVSVFYHKVLFHTITPIAFFLMIAGLYNYDFSKFKYLRFIAYYSYNWYLWHPIVRLPIKHFFGYTALGGLLYIVISFSIAMFFTIIIEEPALSQRRKVLNKLFKRKEEIKLELVEN